MYIETKLINYSFSHRFTGSHQRLLKCLLALFLALLVGGHWLFGHFSMRSLFTKQWLRLRYFRSSTFNVSRRRFGFRRIFDFLDYFLSRFGLDVSRRRFIAFLRQFRFNRFLDFSWYFISHCNSFFDLLSWRFRHSLLNRLFLNNCLRSRSSQFLFLYNRLGNWFLGNRFGSSQRLGNGFWVLSRFGYWLAILVAFGSGIARLRSRWRPDLLRRWTLRQCLFADLLDGVFLELLLFSPRWYWHIVARSCLHRFSLRLLDLQLLLLSLLLLSFDLVFLFLKLLFSQFDFLLDCSFNFGLNFVLRLFLSFSCILLRFQLLQFFFLNLSLLLLFLSHLLFLFLELLFLHGHLLEHLKFFLLLFELHLLFLVELSSLLISQLLLFLALFLFEQLHDFSFLNLFRFFFFIYNSIFLLALTLARLFGNFSVGEFTWSSNQGSEAFGFLGQKWIVFSFESHSRRLLERFDIFFGLFATFLFEIFLGWNDFHIFKTCKSNNIRVLFLLLFRFWVLFGGSSSLFLVLIRLLNIWIVISFESQRHVLIFGGTRFSWLLFRRLILWWSTSS